MFLVIFNSLCPRNNVNLRSVINYNIRNMKACIFLAPGFEEIEALATCDVLRRCGMEVTLVSILDDMTVTGSNGIKVEADCTISKLNTSDVDWLICPGGMPGSTNLYECKKFVELLKAHKASGKYVAAICAAPAVVLAQAGLLKDAKATCYPGFENLLAEGGAQMQSVRVVVSDKIVTGNGPSSAIPFALKIAELSFGSEVANQVADGMLVNFD